MSLFKVKIYEFFDIKIIIQTKEWAQFKVQIFMKTEGKESAILAKNRF